jgi:hypothetical protein
MPPACLRASSKSLQGSTADSEGLQHTLRSLEVDLRDLYITIYFQRDLLLTNLLSTRSTSNDGFEDAQCDLLSTRSTFNDTCTYTYTYTYYTYGGVSLGPVSYIGVQRSTLKCCLDLFGQVPTKTYRRAHALPRKECRKSTHLPDHTHAGAKRLGRWIPSL